MRGFGRVRRVCWLWHACSACVLVRLRGAILGPNCRGSCCGDAKSWLASHLPSDFNLLSLDLFIITANTICMCHHIMMHRGDGLAGGCIEKAK